MEQFPAVYSMSVRDNLCLGRPVDEEKMRAVCRKTGIDEKIRSLPEGYETILAEKGQNLSGGQAQRLVLARTLLRDASLLIFDEPTSALDPGMEERFWKVVEEWKETRSILVITHSREAQKHGDVVWQLSDGQIKAI